VSKKKKTTYTPMPQVPEAIRDRFTVVMQVQSGAMTVSEGARKLGMSRNQFQSMMHKAMAGMIEAMTPKSPGRPPKPEAEAKLRVESDKLRRENDKLKAQVGSTHQMLELVADIFNRRIDRAMSARESRPKSKKETSPNDDAEDDLRALDALRRTHRLRMLIAAALVGASPATARRWRARQRAGLPLRSARNGQRRSTPSPEVASAIDDNVRAVHGLIGADALRVLHGVSRRQAADVKRRTLIAMERERIACAERVYITAPGVVRGMDGMYVMTAFGVHWLLLFGDASVAFRTSAHATTHYDASAVAHAIDDDFRRNGAPLVLRMDRASAQRAPQVKDVLAHHRVVVLHGPPRHPGFYGQQERQNRDHRAWLDACPTAPAPDTLPALTAHMLAALNAQWPQRRLGWRTPAQAWKDRLDVESVRDTFHSEVTRYHDDYRRRDVPDDLAQRFAIEKALTQHGWLRREAGGWC
jgi:transposase-like protein